MTTRMGVVVDEMRRTQGATLRLPGMTLEGLELLVAAAVDKI